MNTYRVSLSDRQRARTISAESASAAVCQAVGQRLFSANTDSHEVDRAGKVLSTRFHLNIRNGRTVGGSTPVLRAWATVTKL